MRKKLSGAWLKWSLPLFCLLGAATSVVSLVKAAIGCEDWGMLAAGICWLVLAEAVEAKRCAYAAALKVEDMRKSQLRHELNIWADGEERR